MAADLVITGARVWPADERYDGATAVAIAGGRIAFVGADEEARSFIGKGTRVVEARGRALLPGMVDAHQHLLYCSRVGYYNLCLSPEMDEAACVATVREYAARNPGRGAYCCVGFAPERFSAPPRREALDATCASKPVVALSYDGHVTWANSRALAVAGIDENTPDPARGFLCRDADGRPTGWLLGAAGACAGGLLSRFMPAYTRAQNRDAILRAQAEMLARGVTTVYDAHVEADPDYFMAYEELARERRLALRVRGAWFVARETGGEQAINALVDRCAGYVDQFRTDRFRVNGFKFLLDMTVEAGTAHLLEPYRSRAGFCGVRVWEDGDMLARLFRRIDRMGYQIHLHQMGDGAAAYALDALERAGNLRARHTFAHCQLILDADKARMAGLGVSALVAPYWMNASVWSSVALPLLGEARAARQYPVRSLLDAGVRVGAHSDYTVSEPSFCCAFYGLMRRKLSLCAYRRFFPSGMPEAKQSLPPDAERVSAREAVGILTLGGAYSMCEEDETGSITPGKAADLALLSGDIGDLCEGEGCIEVDMTVCAGEVAFER